jgi:hypothetical protein
VDLKAGIGGNMAKAFGGYNLYYTNKSSTSYSVAVHDLVDKISTKSYWINGI